jgi:hypothetical protein
MKKLFLLAVTALTALSLTAQLKIDMVLSNTPPATLSEWGNRKEVLTCIVTGQPGLAAEVKIKAEIKTLDGTVIGTTDLARASLYSFAGSALVLTANDVLPLDRMIFNGKYKTSLQRTGKLPSDNYMLCVQLVRATDYSPFSNQVCKNFYLATTQLPILMKPYNEEVLDVKQAQTAITFRWTPVVPKLPTPLTYRLQVFEVLENQTPMQALRSNQPVLDQNIIAATQYIWRPQLGMSDLDKNTTGLGFIWTIQSLDSHGNPVTQTDGSGEGRSEPLVFYIGNKNKSASKPPSKIIYLNKKN